MKRTRSLIKAQHKVEYYRVMLKKLCHSKECKIFEYCPRSCCPQNLGFHTAIMWALADTLYTLRYAILETKVRYTEVHQCDGIISTLNWVSHQHPSVFTKNQYKILRSAIGYSSKLISYMQSKLQEGYKDCYVEDMFRR